MVNEPISVVDEPISLADEPIPVVNEPISVVNEPAPSPPKQTSTQPTTYSESDSQPKQEQGRIFKEGQQIRESKFKEGEAKRESGHLTRQEDLDKHVASQKVDVGRAQVAFQRSFNHHQRSRDQAAGLRRGRFRAFLLQVQGVFEQYQYRFTSSEHRRQLQFKEQVSQFKSLLEIQELEWTRDFLVSQELRRHQFYTGESDRVQKEVEAVMEREKTFSEVQEKRTKEFHDLQKDLQERCIEAESKAQYVFEGLVRDWRRKMAENLKNWKEWFREAVESV